MKHRLPDVTESVAGRIDRRFHDLSRLDTLRELEERFLGEAARILPGDFLCWNNWSNKLNCPISMETNDGYGARAESLNEAFAATLIHHPVFQRFEMTCSQVMRVSDFESDRKFQKNPVFKEVYRHLDARYQVAYTPTVLKHHRIVLTWNRSAMDFNDRDVQIFLYMGIRAGEIARTLQEREALMQGWRRLCGFLDLRLPFGNAGSLLDQDAVVLAALLRSGSRTEIANSLDIRRDSLDKRLGSIREKLGLENHHQLLSALADLRPLLATSENHL
jgi:DNA-binding CsgD family transcriptional regulator